MIGKSETSLKTQMVANALQCWENLRLITQKLTRVGSRDGFASKSFILKLIDSVTSGRALKASGTIY